MPKGVKGLKKERYQVWDPDGQRLIWVEGYVSVNTVSEESQEIDPTPTVDLLPPPEQRGRRGTFSYYTSKAMEEAQAIREELAEKLAEQSGSKEVK